MPQSIAIIGASSNRSKFGNMAVRAYRKLGWEVFPINPSESTIEGLPCYPSITALPKAVDRVSLYLPPPRIPPVLREIATTAAREVFFNPGTESEENLALAEELGLQPVVACSIVFAGARPGDE